MLSLLAWHQEEARALEQIYILKGEVGKTNPQLLVVEVYVLKVYFLFIKSLLFIQKQLGLLD